jgi:hypothetical protein
VFRRIGGICSQQRFLQENSVENISFLIKNDHITLGIRSHRNGVLKIQMQQSKETEKKFVEFQEKFKTR